MHRHQAHPPHDHDGPPDEGGGDSAHRSLSEALRISFKALTVIMAIVVVLYCISGITTLEQDEKALVLRFGVLRADIKGPGGWVVALPPPIDEIIKMPVAEKRTLVVRSQDLKLKTLEDGSLEERSKVQRTGGLDPAQDGSLMTADKGLVHATWVVTYEIHDLEKLVRNIYGSNTNPEREVLLNAVEHAAIEVIGRMESIDVTGEQILDIQVDVRDRAQALLDHLDSGIQITTVDAKTNWPKQAEQMFVAATEAGNEQDRLIKKAEEFKTRLLNTRAGRARERLDPLFREYMAAQASGRRSAAEGVMSQIEQVILTEAKGTAGERIHQARSFKKRELEGIQGDVKEFEAYLAEYQQNPHLLINRLWTQTQLAIYSNPEVTKRYLPAGQKQIRLQISPDPQERQEREKERYLRQEKEKGDFTDVNLDQAPALSGRKIMAR